MHSDIQWHWLQGHFRTSHRKRGLCQRSSLIKKNISIWNKNSYNNRLPVNYVGLNIGTTFLYQSITPMNELERHTVGLNGTSMNESTYSKIFVRLKRRKEGSKVERTAALSNNTKTFPQMTRPKCRYSESFICPLTKILDPCSDRGFLPILLTARFCLNEVKMIGVRNSTSVLL